MNGRHWTDFSEAELARMRPGRTRPGVRASRRGHVTVIPDVTGETKAFLAGLASPEPAYPAWWLPEIHAAQTPADWMKDNAPDLREHRNGHPDPAPASDAYPLEWLQGMGGLGSGALGGEGFLTDRTES